MRYIFIIAMMLLSNSVFADSQLIGKWQLVGSGGKILTFIDDAHFLGVTGKKGNWKRLGKDTLQIEKRHYRFNIEDKPAKGMKLLHLILLAPDGSYNGQSTYLRVEE